ncbi:hypothetical protein ACV566_03140 [Staphylococcus aureus]
MAFRHHRCTIKKLGIEIELISLKKELSWYYRYHYDGDHLYRLVIMGTLKYWSISNLVEIVVLSLAINDDMMR